MKELTSKELISRILEAYSNSKDIPADSVWNDICKYYSWERIGKKSEELYSK